VASISRGRYPELEQAGVTCFQADLGREVAEDADGVLRRAARGRDAIFHAAAKAGIWGSRDDFWSANIEATRNVIEAALREGVPRLVHTSSPSACFTGASEVMADETLPLATQFLAHYPESKAIAERMALGADGAALSVTVQRPHLIFGPGDPHLLPRLVERGRRGRLKRVGSGTNQVTLCYVENAAAAQLAAAERLGPGAPHAGKAYFIGQLQPVLLWEWIDELFAALDVPPVRSSISWRSAHRIGAICEALWRVLPLGGEPPMTRFVAGQLSTSHSYTLEPAARDFGYREVVPLDVAMERTLGWLREQGS
jgi:nucleoside-diphosphate-sugar epimerase